MQIPHTKLLTIDPQTMFPDMTLKHFIYFLSHNIKIHHSLRPIYFQHFQGNNDPTDLAKIELLQTELETKQAAADKLKEKSDEYPSHKKRLKTVLDNLDKVDAIAKVRSVMLF